MSTTRLIRRGLMAIIAVGVVIVIVSRCSSSTPRIEDASAGRASTVPGVRSHGGSAEPRRATMPPLDDRIGALVSEHGHPPAREALLALAAAVGTLRERESSTDTNPEHRAALAVERRAVSKQTREVLESLTPSYRAAMRRGRISVRQLATWTAGTRSSRL